MAQITTFGTLKSELLALLGRAPIDATYQMVTTDINRDLRIVEMEATGALTSTAYALPAGFLEMIDAYTAGTPRNKLVPTTADTINDIYDSGGTTATHYAVTDSGLVLNNADTSDVLIRYYTAVTALSADGDTNVVLTKYPGVYLYGSLYHHSRLVRAAEAAAEYQADYAREMTLAGAAATRARMRGGTPIVNPRAVA